MDVIGGRGNRKDLADRLDPIGLLVIVNEGGHDFDRRSSSVWAKYADALRKISLACGRLAVLAFQRNDQLLLSLPIGVAVFPGSGITDNLADKAKALVIPVWWFRGRCVNAQF